MRTRTRIVAAGVVATLAAGAVGAGAWTAFGADDRPQQRGTCGGSVFELGVEDDDGGVELEWELQTGAPFETWVVQVEQGDDVVLVGERTTDEDAEIDLDTPVDPDGSRSFTVTATPADGAPCVATTTR